MFTSILAVVLLLILVLAARRGDVMVKTHDSRDATIERARWEDQFLQSSCIQYLPGTPAVKTHLNQVFLVHVPGQNESVTHRTDREHCRVAPVPLGAEEPQGLGV